MRKIIGLIALAVVLGVGTPYVLFAEEPAPPEQPAPKPTPAPAPTPYQS